MFKKRFDNYVNAALDIMCKLEEIQDDPCVGIFWYDTEDHELFGTYSSISTSLLFSYSSQFNAQVRREGRTHASAWAKEKRRGSDNRFQKNYDSVPRGEVVEFEHDGFKVYTGHWIDKYPEAKDIILEEFQLNDEVEFIKDERFE